MASSTQQPTVTVLYFSAAMTATGVTSEEITIPSPEFKLSSLGSILVSRHPSANLQTILDTSQWSVDLEMVEDPDTVILKGGEEVAVICPVSGG